MKKVYEEIISNYFETLNKNINQNKVDLKSVTSILMVISEYWQELYDKELWIENVYKLLCSIKSNFFEIVIHNGIGSFNGLSDLLFTVDYVNRKTSAFGKFYHSLREVSINILNEIYRNGL